MGKPLPTIPQAKPLSTIRQPKPLPRTIESDEFERLGLGDLWTEFNIYMPNEHYSFVNRVVPQGYTWKIIKPEKDPPIPPLPLLVQNLMKATWKFAEPSPDNNKRERNVSRGIILGTGGFLMPMVGSDTYHRQVRPTQTVLPVLMPNDTKIASDWKLFEQIERTNAVTFRGDSRDPKAIIRVFKGFGPPNSRTDAYYLENNVYEAFKWYLNQRYKRDLTQKEFLNALHEAAPTMKQQSLLVDYMMWRKITDKEAVHLGRMVENECLKGYISTARAIDTSLEFATREGDNFHAREGWLYLTVVHGAFVVPPGAHLYWGSQEAEIAQWGAIPAARVVGFRHVTKQEIPDGHIFIRRSFRMLEPKVSDYMMAVMSGWIPS